VHIVKWLLYALQHLVMRLFGDKKQIAGVRVLLVRDGRVVLVQHWYKPEVWTLPGGGIKKGETIEDAARREVFEETGFTVKTFGGRVGTYRGRMGDNDSVAVLYTDDFTGGLRIVPDIEIMVRGFFEFNKLPQGISPANRKRIESYINGVRDEQGDW